MHGELQHVSGRVAAIETEARRAAAFSRAAYDEEPTNRRRLWALRASEDYELAFTEDEPLVTFVVPTYTSHETLRDVALPSILGQTYANLEVIVVGDAAPPETAEAIAAVDDPRVRYYNRTYRGPYPDDRSTRWYVIGTPPINEALARARGRWIGTLGDDDAVRPTHTEHLLAAAREHRYEHCYGKQLVNFLEGEPMTLGTFPPELGQWGLQSALFHSGLRFIEAELSDAAWPEPNDWSMCRRMLRAGVRTGMIDEIVVDKFETRRSSSEAWKEGRVPEVD
jgi:glycosyltransferase involved in cell wall biosynthesis